MNVHYLIKFSSFIDLLFGIMIMDIVGPKDLGTLAHFITSPRLMPRKKKCPRKKQRESRLPGYTTEDNPVLGRPKSPKEKNATSLEAVPSSIPKEVSNPMGQP